MPAALLAGVVLAVLALDYVNFIRAARKRRYRTGFVVMEVLEGQRIARRTRMPCRLLPLK